MLLPASVAPGSRRVPAHGSPVPGPGCTWSCPLSLQTCGEGRVITLTNGRKLRLLPVYQFAGGSPGRRCQNRLLQPRGLPAMLQEGDRTIRKEPEDLEAVWGPQRKSLSLRGRGRKSFSGEVTLASYTWGTGGSDVVHQEGRDCAFLAENTGSRSRVGVEMTQM